MQIAVKNDNGFEGKFHIDRNLLKRFTPLSPKVISITHLFSAERKRVESFIEQEFLNSYGAKIDEHYPILISVRDENDNILAALGFRCAKDEALFLEQYLDAPIEQLISSAFSTNISRNKTVEVGNLASSGGGASIFLFTALAAYVQQQGFEYITVTATDFLHRYFKTIGLKPKTIEQASQDKLVDGGASWGSYYQKNPRILAGKITPAYQRLKKHLNIELTDNNGTMIPRLHFPKGRK